MAQVAAAVGMGAGLKAVESAASALKQFREAITNAVEWNHIKEIVKKLKEHEEKRSTEAAGLSGHVKTLLLNAADNYDFSLKEVSGWCSTSVPLLEAFLELLPDIADKDTAEAQKVLLLEVLDDGLARMSLAVNKLDISKSSFNEASGKLDELRSQLYRDVKKAETELEESAVAQRKKAYIGALSGILAFGIGVLVSMAIAVGVTEGHSIPELKKTCEDVKGQLTDLWNSLKSLEGKIADAREAITKEMDAIRSISNQVKQTRSFSIAWAKAPSVLVGKMKTSTTQLVTMCEEFSEAATTKAFGSLD